MARPVNAPDVIRAAIGSDALAALQRRRWAEVPPQWQSLTYDLRDPEFAQHFSRFYDTSPVLDLRMPDAPELWQRELAWWVFKRANGFLSRENAALLIRVVRDLNVLAGTKLGLGQGPPSLSGLDEASWEASHRERFLLRHGRFPDARYVDDLRHHVRMTSDVRVVNHTVLVTGRVGTPDRRANSGARTRIQW